MILETDIKNALRLFPDYDKRFLLKEEYVAYILIKNNIPVSCLCVKKGKYWKVHAAYTPSNFRKKGYFKELLSGVLKMFPEQTFKADCLSSSFGTFTKCGFEFISRKVNNGWVVYHTIRKGSMLDEICNTQSSGTQY